MMCYFGAHSSVWAFKPTVLFSQSCLFSERHGVWTCMGSARESGCKTWHPDLTGFDLVSPARITLTNPKGVVLLADTGLRACFSRATLETWQINASLIYCWQVVPRRVEVNIVNFHVSLQLLANVLQQCSSKDNDRCGVDFFVPWLTKARLVRCDGWFDGRFVNLSPVLPWPGPSW